MKKSILLISVISIFIFNSCCKEGTGTHYPISNNEKILVPYSIGDSLVLNHSNGTDFNFVVTNKEASSGGSEVKHCGDSYYTYDTEKTYLTSNTSELLLSLEISPEEINPYLTITVNRINFNLNIYGSHNLDSMTINGITYYDIYASSYDYLDTNVIQPKAILYNNNKGILQLTMTNNEKYSIK